MTFTPDPHDTELIAFIKDSEAKEKRLAQPTVKKTAEELFTMQLINARLDKGMAQTTLAERAGIPQSALARIEAGKVSPTLKTLVKLADALGMELSLQAK